MSLELLTQKGSSSAIMDEAPSYDLNYWKGVSEEEAFGIIISYQIPSHITLSTYFEETYFLNINEQKAFRQALRNSVKILNKV